MRNSYPTKWAKQQRKSFNGYSIKYASTPARLFRRRKAKFNLHVARFGAVDTKGRHSSSLYRRNSQ